MSDNDRDSDGQYELVVGNRQLLSAFFVVVILFSVFFALGYIVGRNSTPSSKLAAEATASAADERAPASVAPRSSERPSATPDASRDPGQKPLSTQHAARPEASSPEPAAPAKEPAAEVLPEPGPGHVYLQVAAV